ncbi:MAG: DMT family transporter [Nitriliruptor sp.]|uniref:DMT family transporter n=1 Tax=Nitriliruptor sp. TaxID=2448056 RepID=UPI0034A07F53
MPPPAQRPPLHPPTTPEGQRGRGRLLAIGDGSSHGAFGSAEWGLLAAVAVIWGSSFLLIDIGLRDFTPGLVALMRVAFGALALAVVPRARASVDRQDLPRIALLGVTWMGVPLILFPVAQQWIDSSVAGMLNAAVPLTTAVWAAALLRRWPNRRQATGLLLGFAGIVLISLPELPTDAIATQGSGAAVLGVLLVLLAVVLYGLSANLAVPLQQRYGALPVLLRAQLAAMVVVVPFGLATASGSTWSWTSAAAMVPLGMLGTGLAFVLMTTLVGRVGGPRGSIAIYFTPIVAIALGVSLAGEELHPLAALGSVLVIGGAWITSRRQDLPVSPAGRA